MWDQQSLRSACAHAQSDQRLCLSLEYSMTNKLLTEHYLEFLSLKGGCTGSSASTLVKMPHCWKSHVTYYVFDTNWTHFEMFLVNIHNVLINKLTLFWPMEFSIKLLTIKSGCSIEFIDGSQVLVSKIYCISFSKDRFCLNKQCRPWRNAALSGTSSVS